MMVAYHDDEWGVPQHDDLRLFEKITLEGAQAGLSWSTILRKREGYRKAFAGFDPAKVARFTPAKVDRLLLDPGIIRNRAKIESTIANAKAVRAVQRELGSLAAYPGRSSTARRCRTRTRTSARSPRRPTCPGP
jgi:DNA-3-methyladenine glycosylase I